MKTKQRVVKLNETGLRRLVREMMGDMGGGMGGSRSPDGELMAGYERLVVPYLMDNVDLLVDFMRNSGYDLEEPEEIGAALSELGIGLRPESLRKIMSAVSF